MDPKEESRLLGHTVTVKDGRYSVAMGGKTYSGPVDQYRRDRMLRRARILLRKPVLLGDVASDNDGDKKEKHKHK